jgi:hypothetical protein
MVILGDVEAGTTRDVLIPYLGTPHGDNVSVRHWQLCERIN